MAAGEGIAFVAGGSRGFVGMSLGIIGASTNLWALWAVIGLASSRFVTGNQSGQGAAFIVLAFFFKLPFFIALGLLSYHLGPPTLTCFLWGVALVYCGVVGWSVASR